MALVGRVGHRKGHGQRRSPVIEQRVSLARVESDDESGGHVVVLARRAS